MRSSVMQLSALLAAGPAAADLLYVSSYSGSVTTLNLTSCTGGSSVPVMKPVASSQSCGASPSWLTLDHANAVLYCVDENLSGGAGSLNTLRTNADGSLTHLDSIQSTAGPVSSVIYGSKGNGLAMAHYGGAAVTTWNIANPSDLKNVQTLTFKLDGPPADPDRQDKPHPHEAVLDPTGKYVLVPDLGADLIRVFTFDATTLKLTAKTPVKAAPGSGPRHLAFAQKNGKHYAYLITELGNTIVGYELTYDSDIHFKEIFTIGVHGKDKPVPQGSAASEVVVSPDNKFLIASSRAENIYTIPNFDSTNSTKIVSDSLINFSIGDDGSLNVIQDVAAGGRFPRQFSMNKAGTRVAVGMQSDARVVVLERDVSSGRLGKFVGYANVAGEITSVIFDE